MIHRAEHIENYTVVSNELLHDSRLTWEARGFLIYLLTLPDDWSFNIKGLISQTGTKKDVLLRLVKELKESGYISIKQETGKRGVFTAKTWEIYEDCTEVGIDRTRRTPNTVNTEHGEIRTRKTPNTVLTEHGENRLILNTNIKQSTNSKQSTKDNKGQSALDSLSPELRETFESFIEMRKKIKAPLTDKALELNIKKAEKLAEGDPEKMKAIVEQSIEKSWRGLFPLDSEKAAAHCMPSKNTEIDWNEVERLAEAGGDL